MITKGRKQKIEQVVSNRQSGLIVVLEDIHDPHNAAAILRSCDAFGVQDVFFVFKTVKPYNPRKVGKVTSSSANKWLDYEIFDSTEKCFLSLKKRKYKIFGTILDKQAKSLLETKFTVPRVALVIGNEHAGLSEEAIKMVDYKIYIPMQGMVQSLNVSVTAGVCLFEIFRQRKGKRKFLLNKVEQEKLITDFIKR